MAESFRSGIENWADLDLLVILDSHEDMPKESLSMQMNALAFVVKKGTSRRLLMGPTSHLAQNPLPEDTDEHPFCPCCLFTNSIDAFKILIESELYIGIRLFAARNTDGSVAADCRVNGEDYEAGAQALMRYAESWPQRGLEFRKQYAVIQTIPKVA